MLTVTPGPAGGTVALARMPITVDSTATLPVVPAPRVTAQPDDRTPADNAS
jgi:hypothetical protein